MRNNTKKGFTLVELLVVIAILAILATVSVVGYTSFIERADISVDEQTVTQLNHFLEAYKVNNPEVIDDTNIRRITADILELAGMTGRLEPKSTGRNFYFDKVNQEFVLKEDKEYTTSGLSMHFPIHAGDNTPKSDFLGSCFTDGNIFIVSTGGNALADVINGFYSLDNENTKTDEIKSTISNLVQKANALVGDYPELAAFVNSSAVIHRDTKYHVAEDNNYIIIPDNANRIGDKVEVLEDVVNNGWKPAETDIPLVTPKEGETSVTVDLPDSIEQIDASNSSKTDDTNKIEYGMNGKTAEEVAAMFLPKNDVEVDIEIADDTIIASVEVKISENKTVTVNTIITSENGVKVSVNVVVDGNEEIPGSFDNDLDSFDGEIVTGSDNKYAVVNNAGYIAWEKGASITLGATNLKGKDSSLPVTGGENITWDVHADSEKYAKVENNVVELLVGTTEIPETLKFVGTAKNGKTTEYTVNVVYLTGIDYKIDGASVTTGNMTLLYGDKLEDGTVKTTFTVTQHITENNYSVYVEGIEFAPVVTLTNNDFTLTNGVLAPKSSDAKDEYTITLETEGYSNLNKTVTFEIFNVNSLVFKNDHANHVYAGTTGAITLGDLFALEDGKEIPAGAQVWFLAGLGNDKFSNMDGFQSRLADVVDLADNWESTEITFKNGSESLVDANTTVQVAIVAPDHNGNYYRISTNRELTIVKGVNVTSFAQLDGTTNNILYGDIEMSSTDKVLTLSKDKTLYGSGYSIDMTGYNDLGTPFTKDGNDSFTFVDLKKTVPYSKTDEALITLKGATLSNVKIVGEVYKSADFIYQNPTDFGYGSSLVKAEGGSYIVDCYLANTRSPLITTGAVTVEDTTIFGGNYANVDVRNGSTLTLKGDVTTINQIIAGVTDNTVGFGIAVDIFADYAKTSIVIDKDCDFTQYNYVKQSELQDANGNDRMPVVTYGIDITIKVFGATLYSKYEDVNVFLSKEINNVFANKDAYGSYLFEDEYVNSGIVFMNGLQVLLNKTDMTESVTDARTGNGNQVSGLENYKMLTVTATREKALVSSYKLYAHANVFMWTPDKDKVEFNNNVPTDLLPEYVLTH